MSFSISEVVFFIVFILFMSALFVAIISQPTEYYEMPNGIECSYKSDSMTIEFYGCEDDKRYINPEKYKTLPKK